MRRKQKERVLLLFFVGMLVIMVSFFRPVKAENAFVVEEEATFGGEETNAPPAEPLPQPMPESAPRLEKEVSQPNRREKPETSGITVSENSANGGEAEETQEKESEKTDKLFVVPKKKPSIVSQNAVTGENTTRKKQDDKNEKEAEPGAETTPEEKKQETKGKTPGWWLAMVAAGLLVGSVRIVWRIRIRCRKL